jgi:hypothetical protein
VALSENYKSCRNGVRDQDSTSSYYVVTDLGAPGSGSLSFGSTSLSFSDQSSFNSFAPIQMKTYDLDFSKVDRDGLCNDYSSSVSLSGGQFYD